MTLLGKITRAVLLLLILAYAVYLVAGTSGDVGSQQWDFRTYYYAAKAYQMDLDPYELENLTAAAGDKVSFPFAYPPATLTFFGLFTSFEYATAHQLWLFLKMFMLVALLVGWRRYFVSEGALWPFALFMLLAFDAAIYYDIKAGNVSILEQFLLWLGFLAFTRQKRWLFCGLVLLASMFKLSTAFFLLLVLLDHGGHRLRWSIVIAAAIALLFAVNYIPEPGLTGSYVSAVQGIKENAIRCNYASLEFLSDICKEFSIHKITDIPSWVPYTLYGGAIAAVLLVSFRFMGWRIPGELVSDRRLLVFLMCVIYALIAPRMKCYSLILVLVPAYYIIRAHAPRAVFPLAFLLLVLTVQRPLPQALTINHFAYYYPLYIVIIVWLLYLHHLSKGRVSPTEVAQQDPENSPEEDQPDDRPPEIQP